MNLRVSGDFDLEPVAGLGADEFDEFIGVVEFARVHGAGRQIAAQRDQMADALALIVAQNLADVLAGRADARQVRRGLGAGRLNLAHGVEGAVAGRAAGAEGDGKELGVELRKLLAHGAQLVCAFRRLGGEKFKTEGACRHDQSLELGMSAESTQAMTPYRSDPSSAGTKPPTAKPGSTALASQNRKAFSTR